MSVIGCGEDWNKEIIRLLDDGLYQDALETAKVNCTTPTNDVELLISTLVKKLVSEDSQLQETAFDILSNLAENLSPDDMMIALIESEPDLLHQSVFSLILKVYRIILSRNTKTELVLSWCLASLNKVFATKRGLANCMNVFEDWYDFLSDIISIVSLSKRSKYDCCASILRVLKIEALGDKKARVVNLFLRFFPNPMEILGIVSFSASGRSHYKIASFEETNDSAWGILFSFLLTDSACQIPLVYAIEHKFACCSPAIVALLGESSTELQEMGVKLAEAVIPPHAAMTGSGIFPFVKPLLEKLNFLMVYSENECIRQSSLRCFEAILNCYDPKGQYQIFLGFRSSVNHPGSKAFIISKIKKNVEVSSKKSSLKMSEYFTGKRLFDLLSLYCFTVRETENELIQEVLLKPILSSLNFFYWLMCLERQNIMTVPLLRGAIENYLPQVKDLISDALLNCEEEIRKLESGGSLELSIDITNLTLPKLSTTEQLQSIRCAETVTVLVKDAYDRLAALFPVE